MSELVLLLCCPGFPLWISRFESLSTDVIPKSDSEGGRQRDLTTRMNRHGRKLGMTPCARTGAATLHRHDKPTLGPSLARFPVCEFGMTIKKKGWPIQACLLA